jgi:hypothetical protein
MVSTKSTETPKKEGKILKPDQVKLDGDSRESENDNTDTVADDDDYYERLGPDQSLLQWELTPSQSDYTYCYCVQVQIPLLKHQPQYLKVEERINQIYGHYNSKKAHVNTDILAYEVHSV